MSTRMTMVSVLVAVGGMVVLPACGGSGSDADPAPPTTSATSTSVASTSAPAEPKTYAEAVDARLAEELGDAVVAATVVDGLAPEALTALEAKVPGSEVDTTGLFRYQPERGDDDEIDSIVVFAFGNRLGDDGAITSGPTNEALADATEAFVQEHPVPVYAQWEVAEMLQARDVADVVSIEPKVAPDGTVTYLSTAGVADEIVAQAAAARRPLGRVGIIAFADHAVRCVMTAETAGMDAVVPQGAGLPEEYDPASGQPWTRDRASYISTDLAGRLATFEG